MLKIKKFVCILIVCLLPAIACQSDRIAKKTSSFQEPVTAEDARYYNGIDLLTSADQEYQEYHRNLVKLNMHFSTTLHAINRSLFVKPQCVSTWFEKISKVDLELISLAKDEEKMFDSLRKQHQKITSGEKIELDRLEKIRSDLSYNDSKMQLLLPQMSQILAHALQQHQGC